MSIEYKQFNLTLSEEMHAKIVLMRKPLNAKDDGEVIRKALALAMIYVEAEKEGKHLAIVNSDYDAICNRVVL